MSLVRGAGFVVVVARSVSRPLVRAAAGPDTRPNILFIFADDHAAHAMSCYGSRINKTPNLDRIAAGGMLFHNCFCTNSICGPSRAVVLTGKHSHQNGFLRNGDRFDGSQPTFPKMLQQAGYQTAIIGKWHLASDPTGFRPLENPHRAGNVLQPGPDRERQARPAHRLRHRPPHRSGARLPEERPRSAQALSADVPPQGPAPRMGAEPQAPAPVRRRRRSPSPSNLFDDYRGRGTAARVQQMEVVRDLKPRDLKLVPPKELNARPASEVERRLRAEEPGLSGRTPDRNRSGPLEVPAVHQGLFAVRRVGGRKRRPRARLPRSKRSGEEHGGDLLVRPGILSGRPRLVRQAVHVRRIVPDAAPDPLARRHPTRLNIRRPGLKPGLRRNVLGDGRLAGAARHAGPQPGPASGRPYSRRLAHELVLPILRLSGRPHGQ